MKISFVIPAYNEEKLLPKCLESIQSALKKHPYDAEVIVVNNASTDRTHAVAASFPAVTVVDEPRKGLTHARQTGFEHSSGNLIANVDADTILTDRWVDTALSEFEKDPTLVALAGPFIYYDLPWLTRTASKIFISFYPLMHFIMHDIFRYGAILQGGNFVLRRTALEKIGGFNRGIAFYGEDTDIARRISKVGRVKWTLRFPMYASGRRLKHEGTIRMGWRYTVNFFVTTFTGRPATEEYVDIRE